jgi:hypothetical protein
VASSCNLNKKDEYQDGIARVEDYSSGKYGFVNTEDEIIIEKKYDWASSFNEGYAQVELNGKRGIINRSGDIVIPIKYDNVMPLSDNYFSVEQDNKYGIYNSLNEEIVPIVTSYIKKVYSGKYFEVRTSQDENSICLINSQGKRLTSCEYIRVDKILPGDFAIMVKQQSTNKYSYKIYDLKNDNSPLNELSFLESIQLLNPDDDRFKYMFKVKRYSVTETPAVIDYKGKIIIPFNKYRDIHSFSEGVFSVTELKVDNRNIIYGQGYVDLNGGLITKLIFDKVEKFENGIGKVTFKDKTFFINKNAECVKDCPSEKWKTYHNVDSFKVKYNPDIAANNKLYENWTKLDLDSWGEIRISPNMEIQDGIYKKILDNQKNQFSVSGERIVIQQKGLNNGTSTDTYARIIIRTDYSSEYLPNLEELNLTIDDLEFLNNQYKEQIYEASKSTPYPFQIIKWNKPKISLLNGNHCITYSYVRQLNEKPQTFSKFFVFWKGNNQHTINIEYRLKDAWMWKSEIELSISSLAFK